MSGGERLKRDVEALMRSFTSLEMRLEKHNGFFHVKVMEPTPNGPAVRDIPTGAVSPEGVMPGIVIRSGGMN